MYKLPHLVAWIKKKLGIHALEQENRELRGLLKAQEAFVVNKMAELKEYTRVDADVGIRGNNTIILTGVYRNQAYVRFYDMGDENFKYLVDQVKDMSRHSLIRNIDAPPNFRGIFNI